MLISYASQAQETQYVTDELRITVRTDPGNQYKIIKTLRSGEKLEVLERTNTGYARVRTSDETEGWIRSQYLTKQPIARQQLTRVEKRLDKIQKQNSDLTKLVNELQDSASKLETERNELIKTNTTLEKETALLNEVAKRPIQLDKENKQLKQTNVSFEKDLQLLEQENQSLKDKSARNWFLLGAAVLLVGILLGLLLPKLRHHKKRAWDF